MYKQKTTNILTKYSLPIKSDLISRGKQCRSNNDSPPKLCFITNMISNNNNYSNNNNDNNSNNNNSNTDSNKLIYNNKI